MNVVYWYSNWYKEKAVWYNESQKSRIFQFLYDLTEINFDLISKSNFELDTTWPSVQLNNPNNPRILITRHRTNSITSYTSYYQEKDHIDNLSSTPHDLEGEFLFQKMNKVTEDDAESVDIHNTYQLELENHESKIAELTNRLALKESQLDTVIEELKKKDEPQMSANGTQNSKHDVSSSNDNDSTMFLEKMAAQITFLNDQLASKVNQNLELNDCLIKQTSMCENLSELLRQSQDKLAFLDADRSKNIHVAEKMQDQFGWWFLLKRVVKSAFIDLELNFYKTERKIKNVMVILRLYRNIYPKKARFEFGFSIFWVFGLCYLVNQLKI